MEMLEDNRIKFDFLGKDSIRYENTVEVTPEVWKNMKAFKKTDRLGKAKPGSDNLFDAMNAQVRAHKAELHLFVHVPCASACVASRLPLLRHCLVLPC